MRQRIENFLARIPFKIWILIAVVIAVGILFLVGSAHADPVYDIRGGNALVKGELKAKRVKPWIKTIDSYADLETVSGESVFQVDLSKWSEYQIDVAAIYDSTFPWTVTGLTTFAQNFSGVTVQAQDVVGNFANVLWSVAMTGVDTSGATPVWVWKPDNGTLRGTGASGEWITGASLWTIDDLGDRKTFQNGPVGGGVSVFEIDNLIGG